MAAVSPLMSSLNTHLKHTCVCLHIINAHPTLLDYLGNSESSELLILGKPKCTRIVRLKYSPCHDQIEINSPNTSEASAPILG